MHILMILLVTLIAWSYIMLIFVHLEVDGALSRKIRLWSIRRLLKTELNWSLRIVRSQEFQEWCLWRTGDENTAILLEGLILSPFECIDPFPLLDEISHRFGFDSYDEMFRTLPVLGALT